MKKVKNFLNNRNLIQCIHECPFTLNDKLAMTCFLCQNMMVPEFYIF